MSHLFFPSWHESPDEIDTETLDVAVALGLAVLAETVGVGQINPLDPIEALVEAALVDVGVIALGVFGVKVFIAVVEVAVGDTEVDVTDVLGATMAEVADVVTLVIKRVMVFSFSGQMADAVDVLVSVAVVVVIILLGTVTVITFF